MIGYLAAIIALLLVLGLIVVLVRNIFSPGRSDPEWEIVDIIEGGSIVEQQKHGRERWRKVVVIVSDRPLTFEERLNLASIKKSKNPNVQIQE